MLSKVFNPFSLPNGQTVKNRMVKAAMEENMAVVGQLPGTALFNLYRHWATGGVGMIITGNVMVDKLAMTGPGGVALEADTDLAPFETWANIIKQEDAMAIMQINHPGRQVQKALGGKTLAPSSVAIDIGRHSGLFALPDAMTSEQISDVKTRFVTTAKQAQKAGFDGVEVHAAHGYLLSQFLSPLTNKREDCWGGNLGNRARLLVNIVSEVRAQCGSDFVIMVKLNAADFLRGGFTEADAVDVAKMLEASKVDVLEVSGGSYESPAMQGKAADERTLAREAYFLEFAKQIGEATSIPMMTTGGIKRLPVAESVLDGGCELLGMASAMATTPDLPKKWQQHPEYTGFIPRCDWRDKAMASLATMAMVKRQLRLLGKNAPPAKNPKALWSLVLDQIRIKKLTKRYRKTVSNRA